MLAAMFSDERYKRIEDSEGFTCKSSLFGFQPAALSLASCSSLSTNLRADQQTPACCCCSPVLQQSSTETGGGFRMC